VLESDGIPAALLDAQIAGLGLGPAAGGVRLLVPARDLERAQEILAAPMIMTDELELAMAHATPPPAPHATFEARPPRPERAERRFVVLRFAFWAALVLAGLAVLALLG
jgi:Putative prokaryotic signal transducing protein